MTDFTGAMDPYGVAGVHSRRDGQGPNEDYSTYPNRPIPSPGTDQTMLTTLTTGHDSVVDGGATGHFFNQEPHSSQFPPQGSITPDPQAYQGVYKGYQPNPSFEYDPFPPRHAPPTEHGHLHQSIPSNSFIGADAGMHSIASSSSSTWSGLSPLAPAPLHPSAPSSSSYALSASSQYPSHAQTSSPLQAMVSNGQGPSEPDAIKWSEEKTEGIKRLFSQYAWYAVPDEEPPIRPDDPFVTEGLILSTDKTRFSAFVFSSSTGGKAFCRIKHSIQAKNKVVDCAFSAVHPKDAIAHVCDYLNYKPYKCKGTKLHPECNSTYPTKERRNDHYAKKKKGPDNVEPCECGASITTRNVLRHRERCPKANTHQRF